MKQRFASARGNYVLSTQRLVQVGCVLLSAILLSSCGGGGTSSSAKTSQAPDPVTVDLPIAYIKRSIPVDANLNPVFPEVLEPAAFNAGAAIYLKDRATVLSQAINITDAAFEKGALYDVKDLSVSPDGKKLLFAMHAPMLVNVTPDKQPKWHIWEYVIASKTLRPIITSSIVAEQGHDLSPRYLADGRILFSSTRQARSKAILLDDGKPQYSALAEDNANDPAFVLHTMKDDGTDIQQITYNQSHDIQPAVLQNGKILFSHWDRSGHNNLSFYTANPDGTQVERHYGFYSMNPALAAATDPQYRLFRPQEMPDGRVAAIVRPDGQMLGGDMVVIDTTHFFEKTLTTKTAGGGASAETPVSVLPINITPGETEFSKHGRYSSLTPLFDGTQRLLVSWSECRLIEPVAKKLVPCTDAWLATAGVKEAAPLFGIWVYDITKQTQQPVVLGEEGYVFEEPVSLEPRTSPVYLRSNPEADLADQNVGILHIRSVYDIDGSFNNYGRGGITSLDQMLALPADQRPARFVRIIKPVSIPDMATRNSLSDTSYGKLFNGFTGLREVLGYAPVEPDGSVRIKVPADMAFTLEILDKNGRRIGLRHNTWLQLRPGEVRECSGCHDGSKVGIGHGRKDAEPSPVNAGAATSGVAFTNSLRFDALATPAMPTMGETMAEFAARTTFCLIPGDATTCAPFSNKAKSTNPRALSVDLVFDDEWTNTAVRARAASFAWRYSALAPVKNDIHAPTSEACMEADGWSSLCRIIINYENHIQPLWERARPVADVATQTTIDRQCISCHTSADAEGVPQVPSGQLELLRTKAANNQRMLSYTELTANTNRQILDEGGNLTTQIPVCELAPADLYPDIAACVINLDTQGKPTCVGVANCPFEQDTVTGDVLLDTNNNPIPRRVTQNVSPSMAAGSANGSARFFNRMTTFNAATDTVDHRGYMNDSEFKLLSEWLDLGGRYYNNPFDSIAAQ